MNQQKLSIDYLLYILLLCAVTSNNNVTYSIDSYPFDPAGMGCVFQFIFGTWKNVSNSMIEECRKVWFVSHWVRRFLRPRYPSLPINCSMKSHCVAETLNIGCHIPPLHHQSLWPSHRSTNFKNIDKWPTWVVKSISLLERSWLVVNADYQQLH